MLQLLSIISGDQTIGFCRSKRESSFTRRELHVGTRIWGFRQTSRGRGSSPTWFNPCLRVIQMVELFGAGTVMHFSPKDLGMNAGFSGLFSNSPGLNFQGCFRTVRKLIFGTVFGQSRLNLWTVFRQSRAEFLGPFLAVSGLIFELLLVHVCCFMCSAKKNNMLFVLKIMLLHAQLMY